MARGLISQEKLMPQMRSSTHQGWCLTAVNPELLANPEIVLNQSRSMLVGRSQNADIVINAEHISRQHAELSLHDGRLKITDLGSGNGTYVNNLPIAEAYANPGDEIRFDTVAFTVQGPQSDATEVVARAPSPAPKDVPKAVPKTAPAIADKAEAVARIQPADRSDGTHVLPSINGYLKGVSPPIKDKVFSLYGERISIGRDQDNDIIIDDDDISSHHGLLLWSKQAWHYTDLESTNGSFINGQEISSAVLQPGQRIALAEVFLCYNQKNPHSFSTGAYRLATAKTSNLPRIAQLSILLILVAILAAIIRPPSWLTRQVPEVTQIRNSVDQLVSPSPAVNLKVSKLWPTYRLPSARSPSTPALLDINQDGTIDVVVGDAKGYVTAIDGVSGQTLFAVQLGEQILAPLQRIYQDDRWLALAAGYNGLIGLYDSTGVNLWPDGSKAQLGKIVHRPVISDVNGDQIDDILITDDRNGVLALDGSRQGWLLWQIKPLIQGRASAAPLVTELNRDANADYVISTDTGQVLAFSIVAGQAELIWEQQLNPILFTQLQLAGNSANPLIIVISGQTEVIALNARSGGVVWRQTVRQKLLSSPTAANLTDDTALDTITVGINGLINAFEASKGALLWQRDLAVKIQASPLSYDFDLDGTADLFVLDTTGKAHIISGVDGSAVIDPVAIPESDSFVNSPLLLDLDGDGNIELITTSQNGAINALSINRKLKSKHQQWPISGKDNHFHWAEQ